MARLVIVGGGASGVLTAAAASRLPSVTEIVLIERADRTGPGLAYGSAAPHHRLNSPAARMGAWQDDPGDFVRWSATTPTPQDAAEFSPRRLYGDYLESVLAGLEGVRVVQGEVVEADGRHVLLADGRSLTADAVVLALGNPPPKGVDPWAPGGLDGLHGRVLLVGTGLTMVDAATSLARADPDIAITATSRHLLLPREHPSSPQTMGPGIEGPPASLGELVRAFHDRLRAARSAGTTWQAEVDGVRPQVDRLWAGLSATDRERFVRHVSRRWEVHRHRMSPEVAAELRGLLETGRLVVGPPSGDYDAVVDCTGPRPFPRPGWNPLVDALLASGAARPDPLGLGLDVDAVGRLRDVSGAADPSLFVIGPARRGTQWETTAIPEIRTQATEVAALVASLA